jgi:hypothetical protein
MSSPTTDRTWPTRTGSREAVLFHLADQQLRSVEMVVRLDAHREGIHRAVARGGPAAYAVRRDRIERTWP